MRVVAAIDDKGPNRNLVDAPLNAMSLAIENLDRRTANDGDVALFKIGDSVGEGRQGQGIRTEEHFRFTVADSQGRTFPGPDQEVLFALE